MNLSSFFFSPLLENPGWISGFLKKKNIYISTHDPSLGSLLTIHFPLLKSIISNELVKTVAFQQRELA